MNVRGFALLASLLPAFAANCGGGGKNEGAKFCGEWAVAFCHKLYACTLPEMRDANFLGGSSESECTEIWGSACSQPPPSGVTFDINCSGGAQVNTAARTMCLDELSAITCEDFNAPAYHSVCTQVCGQGRGGGGAGGSVDGGPATDGAVLTPPTNEMLFCVDLQNLGCALKFNCTPSDMRDALFLELWGATLAACQGKTAALCTQQGCLPPKVFDTTVAAQCVDAVVAYTCADVDKNWPDFCAGSCRD